MFNMLNVPFFPSRNPSPMVSSRGANYKNRWTCWTLVWILTNWRCLPSRISCSLPKMTDINSIERASNPRSSTRSTARKTALSQRDSLPTWKWRRKRKKKPITIILLFNICPRIWLNYFKKSRSPSSMCGGCCWSTRNNKLNPSAGSKLSVTSKSGGRRPGTRRFATTAGRRLHSSDWGSKASSLRSEEQCRFWVWALP